MDPTIVELPGTTEFIWRRPEIPIFDEYWKEGTWWIVLGCVWAVGLIYVVWLYAREARSIRPVWCVLLGLMRLCVYALLGIGFMLPAERTKRSRKIIPPQYAKVAIVGDGSISMVELRDDLPPEGGSLKDMPSRMDKLLGFFNDDKVKFFDRLEKFHTTMYRFAADLDEESWEFKQGKMRSNTARVDLAKKLRDLEQNQQIAAPDKDRMRKELEDASWVVRDRDQLVNILTPQRSPSLPIGWGATEPRSLEYIRQATANKKLFDQRFFENSTIPESVMKVLQQERKQKLQGIVVYTDGRRTLGSLQAAYDLAAAAKDANVPIFIVGLGKELKKVSMEIADLRVPQLIRPEDKFRVVVSVNGTEDMANEKFDMTLDIKRVKRDKNGEAIPQNLQLIKVDDKGLPLKASDGKEEPPINLGPKIRLLATSERGLKNWAKETPVFKPGNPPNAQVEFELDAAEFAEAAGKKDEAKAARDKSVRLGLAPDPDAEFVFQARMIKDPRELAEDRDAEIQFLMTYAKENQQDLVRAADNLRAELTRGDAVVKSLADALKNAGEKNGEAEFQKALRALRSAGQKNLTDLLKLDAKLNDTQRREATLLLGLLRGFHVSDPAGMRVQLKPLRVLLVASAACRDYQYLRTLLVREMEKGRAEVSIWLQTIPGAERRVGIVQDVDPKRLLTDFPTKRILKKGDEEPMMSLASYDVVVMFDPAIKDKDTGEMYMSKEQLKLLNEWVNKDGGGLIYVASDLHTEALGKPLGDTVDKDPLAESSLNSHPILYLRNMLPVVPNVGGKQADVVSDQARRLEFPQATAEMEFLRLDEEDPKALWQRGWERFFNEVQDDEGKSTMVDKTAPPERGFFAYWPVKSIKQNALVLAAFDYSPENPLPGNRKQPFLAVGPWGEGKVTWIGTSEIWRLRMYRDAYHERFWTKLLADAGSKSATSVKRRITAILPRKGRVGQTYTFEVRFEDSNGDPIKRSIDPAPELEITLSRGAEPKVGDQVVIMEGPNAGKKGVVQGITVNKDDRTGIETRRVKVVGVKDLNPGLTPGETTVVDSNKVEIDMPKRKFQPRLGTKPDESLDRKNDGWFKVVYQPTAAVRHTLKIRQGNDEAGVSIHTFDVEPAPPPDLENPAPDPETIFAMASKPDAVFARVKDDPGTFRQDLETELRRVNAKRPKTKAEVPAAPRPGVPAPAPAGDDLRLVFDLDSAALIPSCMKLQVEPPRIEQLPTKTKDLWDNSPQVPRDERSDLTWTIWKDPDDYRKDFILPWFLCVAVGLLSVEWLLRKLAAVGVIG